MTNPMIPIRRSLKKYFHICRHPFLYDQEVDETTDQDGFDASPIGVKTGELCVLAFLTI
ncbi:MAG: hypothetical protein QGG15_03770 [Dehalococcoidales bacterium]|nr:hypothetical protein [Dehalococcoidales bacterium]MDP6738122.1 hypothetical protein [Dehalococcoidales bacterium]